MENENKKLTPLKFLPETVEMPWGKLEYCLADLGFVDSVASAGWLKGNSLSDIMQTYLERVSGDTAFEWYGTQFPVLVKRLQVKGRSALHVNPDDESAEQRYDAFGKTAFWYVEAAGPNARLFLGFKQDVGAESFYSACQEGTVEKLLHSVRPQPGEGYLIPPGLVHAAQDVTLLEIAESSELCFRLHDWGATDRELHLEEAFDLIDLGHWTRQPRFPEGILAQIPQFTVSRIALQDVLKSHRDLEDTFLVYICVEGDALLRAGETDFRMGKGELVLVPAEVTDFYLMPARPGSVLLEVRMDPRLEPDPLSTPVEE